MRSIADADPPWEEPTWGRPTQVDQVDEAIEELRDGTALLVVDTRRKDPDHDDCYDTDPLYGGLEWAQLHRVSVVADPSEHYDSLLVVLTPDWRTSAVVTREIVRAQKMKVPIFFLNVDTSRVTRQK